MPKENVQNTQEVEQRPLSVPMEVTARPIEPMGNLMGFASVKVGGITMKDFKIVNGADGLFVSMPSRPDSKSQSGYRNTVFVDKAEMAAFNEAVVGAYHAAVEKLKDRAAVISGEKPPPIAEQLDKAGKEAAAHNAAKPKKVKADRVEEIA